METAMHQHYEEGREHGRLASVHGQLEFVRSCDLLHRFLPAPPAVILDVGGGTGPYAFHLARAGYEVHLVDAVELHAEQARSHQSEQGVELTSIRVGDARALEFAEASADAVLLMGPLYHLTEREERLQALREAHRVLRTGGVVFAVGISRFASALDGLLSGHLRDPG
jgi:ubiquinone/menaquinone biosynthesis C-methylase UbiE